MPASDAVALPGVSSAEVAFSVAGSATGSAAVVPLDPVAEAAGTVAFAEVAFSVAGSATGSAAVPFTEAAWAVAFAEVAFFVFDEPRAQTQSRSRELLWTVAFVEVAFFVFRLSHGLSRSPVHGSCLDGRVRGSRVLRRRPSHGLRSGVSFTEAAGTVAFAEVAFFVVGPATGSAAVPFTEAAGTVAFAEVAFFVAGPATGSAAVPFTEAAGTVAFAVLVAFSQSQAQPRASAAATGLNRVPFTEASGTVAFAEVAFFVAGRPSHGPVQAAVPFTEAASGATGRADRGSRVLRRRPSHGPSRSTVHGALLGRSRSRKSRSP